MPLASTAPIRLNSTELLLVVAAAPTVELALDHEHAVLHAKDLPARQW
jgi:hypothetical protein